MTVIDNSIPVTLTETLASILRSIVASQSESAQATIDFIKTFCSKGTGANQEIYAPNTVKIKHSKLNEAYEPTEYILEVPLLSLINLPSIEIKKSNISFSYEVMSSATVKAEESGTGNTGTLKGRIVKRSLIQKSDTKTEEKGGINVSIELEKASMPAGIERLMEALELYQPVPK